MNKIFFEIYFKQKQTNKGRILNTEEKNLYGPVWRIQQQQQ